MRGKGRENRSVTLRRILPVIALAVVALVGASTRAEAITFTLGGADFSGGTDNTGGTIIVTITNLGTSGDVQFVVTNNLADGDDSLKELYLNTTAAPINNASISCVDCGDLGTTPSFDDGSNAFKADGDGLYDLLFGFEFGDMRLTSGESITFNVFSTSPLFTEASFNAFSLDAGGHGPFRAAAHIGSLSNGGSDWITETTTNGGTTTDQPPVPEPATLLLFGVALAAGARRLRRTA